VPTGDAVTYFDYFPSFIWTEGAGEYRRLLARRSAGQLKPAS
jgi:hypothetical protein